MSAVMRILAIKTIWFCVWISTGTVNGDLPEHNCHLPLGVANSGLVPTFWLYSSDGSAFRGRINQRISWSSQKPLYETGVNTDFRAISWLQVDLQRPTLVAGIQTQGNPQEAEWVTFYSIYYSDDCEIFTPLKDADGLIARFHGNFDSNTTVTNFFHEISITRCIRLVPLSREGNSTSLRLEILGCDVRVCREATIDHMKVEVNVFNRTDYNSSLLQISDNQIETGGPQPDYHVKPTVTTRGFAEFKFNSEKMLFGIVFHVSPNEGAGDRFIVTYSRNCHKWEPIREKKGFGDPKTFKGYATNYRTRWYSFPYPVRAHCVRIIPITTRYVSKAKSIKAHFIGCGTGEGTIHACGLRKSVPRRSKRVVGGTPSGAGLWPWLVSLEIRDDESGEWRHVCGGSMVHPQWVLTAAHCLNVMYQIVTGNMTRDFDTWNEEEFKKMLRVRIGEHSLTLEEGTHLERKVEEVVIFPGYNITNYMNDIGMLRLKEPIRLTEHASLICLPESITQFNNESNCYVIGWGHTHSGFPSRPHQARVPLIKDPGCQEIYSHLTITPDMMCAGPTDGSADACNGDSGGPLVCEDGAGQWFQMGIASWNLGCAYLGYTGVYVKIPAFVDWIEQVIAFHAQGNAGAAPGNPLPAL